MAGPDRLEQAIEPLQRRILYPQEYEILGREILVAVHDVRIRSKYGIQQQVARAGEMYTWQREGEDFSFIYEEDKPFTLNSLHIIEDPLTAAPRITVYDAYMFGREEVVMHGLSRVMRGVSIGEGVPKWLRLRAKDYGSLRRDEQGLRKQPTPRGDKFDFRRALLTIGQRPE